MINLKIRVDTSSVDAAIARADTAMSVPSLIGFLEQQAVPWMQRRAAIRFNEGGDDASGSWPPLSATSGRWRVYHGFGASKPINVRTGKLRDWVVGNDGIPEHTANLARIRWPGYPEGWTAVKYETAQKGKRFPRTSARPVVAANNEDVQALLAGMAAWVIPKAGLELL